MGNLKESESLNLGSVPEGLLLVCLVRSSALSGSLHSSYLFVVLGKDKRLIYWKNLTLDLAQHNYTVTVHVNQDVSNYLK